jgi:anti-sigma28 factor (negative regulator of flagellin synthesis)
MDPRDNPPTHDLAAADERLTAESLDSVEDVVDQERLKKIARLKQAVADGTYHVSVEDVADKLIAHMLAPKG